MNPNPPRTQMFRLFFIGAGALVLLSLGALLFVLFPGLKGLVSNDEIPSQPPPPIAERRAILDSLEKSNVSSAGGSGSSAADMAQKEKVLEALTSPGAETISGSDPSVSTVEPAASPEEDSAAKLKVLQSLNAR